MNRRIKDQSRHRVPYDRWVSQFFSNLASDELSAQLAHRLISASSLHRDPLRALPLAVWFMVGGAPSQRELHQRFQDTSVSRLARVMRDLETELKKFSRSSAAPVYLKSIVGISELVGPPSGLSDGLPELFRALPSILATFAYLAESPNLLGFADRKLIVSRAVVWVFLCVRRLLGQSLTEASATVATLANAGQLAKSGEVQVDADAVAKRVKRFEEAHGREFLDIRRYLARNGMPGPHLFVFMLIRGASCDTSD